MSIMQENLSIHDATAAWVTVDQDFAGRAAGDWPRIIYSGAPFLTGIPVDFLFEPGCRWEIVIPIQRTGQMRVALGRATTTHPL